MSAFGVEHGWISKAREYKRDANGKFATLQWSKKQKPLTDEEFDQEMDSITDDLDQLYKAEGNDKSWNHWREQLEAAGDYLDSVNEGHAADDVWMAIEHSRDSHEHIRAGRRSLDKAGTRFLNSVGQEVTRTGEFVAPARPRKNVSKSFKKLGPNLRVARGMIAQKHFADDVTMGEKMRYHYLTQRNIAGRAGRKQKELGAERKDISRRFVDTISGANRKNRVLP